MRALVTALLAAIVMASGSVVRAEGDPPPLVYSPGPVDGKLVAGEITPLQRSALYPPRGPRPGLYRMRVLHTGLCVALHTGLAENRQDRPVQNTCRTEMQPRLEDNPDLFAFIPHPAGGHTIRVVRANVENGRAPVPGQLSNCLTAAPGVIFGPVRVEARACEVPTGEGWSGAGSNDQRFLVQQMARDAWELRFAASNVDSPDCMAMQGASRELARDFIKWGCNGNADQRFMLEWVMPLPADLEAATLARSKWFPFADGPHWLSPANGVELMGPNYASFETIADGGEYCMRRCAELSECKAWTWTGPGWQGQAKPMCGWKRDPGSAVHRGRLSYGKIFSGIVR